MSKLYYCPRCGRVVNEKRYMEYGHKCSCDRTFAMFETKYCLMEEEYEDFDLTKPMNFFEITKEMIDLAYEKYVNIPSNKKLNVDAARRRRKSTNDFFASGGNYNYEHMDPREFAAKMKAAYGKPSSPLPPLKPGQCPYCLSMMTTARTSCFDLGGAIIGGALFGEPGAIFGAMGEERTYYVCQKCGNKWEPGKYR